MSSTRVHRTTLFKIPKAEDRKKLVEAYDTLVKDQQKDGKPYILFLCAGEAHEDARSQGYTFVSKTEFASMEDMVYYDNECAAHQALKGVAATMTEDKPLITYFTAAPMISQ